MVTNKVCDKFLVIKESNRLGFNLKTINLVCLTIGMQRILLSKMDCHFYLLVLQAECSAILNKIINKLRIELIQSTCNKKEADQKDKKAPQANY